MHTIVSPKGEQHAPAASFDPADWDAFRSLAHRMIDDLLSHLERIREQPAWQAVPGDVRARVSAMRAELSCQIGIHAHNNLGLAVANSLAAIEEGADSIDGATCGLGGGAGNTQTEVMVAVLDKLGYHTGIDVYRLMDVAEEIVKPILPRPIRPSCLPASSMPGMKSSAQPFQPPRRTSRSPSATRRVTVRISAHVNSATALVRTSGVLVTTMPRSRAAAASMLS